MQLSLKPMGATLACFGLYVLANAQIVINDKVPDHWKLDASKPTKLLNNGKLLSKKGVESIYQKDLTEMHVKPDTIYIMAKDYLLKRLDEDSANYEQSSNRKTGNQSGKSQKQ